MREGRFVLYDWPLRERVCCHWRPMEDLTWQKRHTELGRRDIAVGMMVCRLNSVVSPS